MTQNGGNLELGNIFSINTDGSGYRNVVSFTGTGGGNPGANPLGSLTLASSAIVALTSAANATIISGGTAVLHATLANSATTSTFYGMTQNGGAHGEGTIFSLTVTGANSLNFTIAAAVQNGNATVSSITPATGSLASGASLPCTVSATSTTLGVTTVSFTASDPNSSNLSQSATATLTVLDHAAAAFTNGSGTLNLNFGTLQLGSGTQTMQFQIENLAATFRAGLDLDSITPLSDPSGVFSTDAMSFTDLSAGADSSIFNLFLNTSQLGL